MKGNAVCRFRAPPQLSRDRGRYETRVLYVLFGKERCFIEMFYPPFQSGREHSALALGGSAYSDAPGRGERGAGRPAPPFKSIARRRTIASSPAASSPTLWAAPNLAA
jgi:hypothetical protein